MADYMYISNLTAGKVKERHYNQLQTIKESSAKHDKVIVVTHHAPSTSSIHARYKDSVLNPCFVNKLDDYILDNQNIKYWVHGHTHDTFDYTLGSCKIVANPLGYKHEYKTTIEDYYKNLAYIEL